MKLLDLYAGPGGASVGYERAGWTVVGADIEPWECYPGLCHQADAFDVLAQKVDGLDPRDFDAIHASPPCHAHSSITSAIQGKRRALGIEETDYPDLLGATVDALETLGKPYIVENVPGAPGGFDMLLCGSMFDLPIRRHRYFRMRHWDTPLMAPATCNHEMTKGQVNFYSYGAPGNEGLAWREVERRYLDGLGLDWVPVDAYKTREGPGQIEAIPPAYTEYLGGLLMNALR